MPHETIWSCNMPEGGKELSSQYEINTFLLHVKKIKNKKKLIRSAKYKLL